MFFPNLQVQEKKLLDLLLSALLMIIKSVLEGSEYLPNVLTKLPDVGNTD